jgi:pimeloyl-ACP methyl ester carboxylesterase
MRPGHVGHWNLLMRAFRLLLLLGLPAVGLAQTPPVPQSAYYGKWLAQGPSQLATGVELFERADGTLGAVLVLPGRGLFGGLIDGVAIDGRRISLSAVQADLTLRLTATGHSLSGEARQAGKAFPIELLPVQGFGEPQRPQTPVAPLPYEAEDLVIRTPDGLSLSGTFTHPRGHGRVPTAVLIADSGPLDRDGGAVAGHRPFTVIADYLARREMATFRYDKRGVRRSTGDFLGSTPEQRTADALAVIHVLRARADVGPVGLIGHGEGALLAATLAAQEPQAVDFVVSLAGPGMRGQDLLLLRDRLQFARLGLAGGDLAQLEAYDRRFYDTVLSHPRPDELLPALKALQAGADGNLVRRYASEGTLSLAEAGSPAERGLLTADAPAAWRRVACPVLALNGTLDTEMPAQENLAGIRAALHDGGNIRSATVSLPGLNHLFQHASSGLPGEYGVLQETISPEALHRVALFVSFTAAALRRASPEKLTEEGRNSMDHADVFAMPLGVALSLLFFCAAVVAIVLIVSRHRRAQAALQHKTALELAQRGLPLPPHLLADTGVSRLYSDLRTGLVLTALGAGAIAFALTLPNHPAWGLGLIPLFAGLGYLLTYLVGRAQQSSRDRV